MLIKVIYASELVVNVDFEQKEEYELHSFIVRNAPETEIQRFLAIAAHQRIAAALMSGELNLGQFVAESSPVLASIIEDEEELPEKWTPDRVAWGTNPHQMTIKDLLEQDINISFDNGYIKLGAHHGK